MFVKYKGSCHCGRVAFEVEGTIDSGLACNCSICQRKGSLLWFVPRDRLRVLTPEANASTYTYGEGTDPKGNHTAAINLRCLEGIDLASIPVENFDGRAL
jgi:hypothetical protein